MPFAQYRLLDLGGWDWKGALASRTLINHRRCDSIMWKIQLSSEVASTRDKRRVNRAWNQAWNEKKGFFRQARGCKRMRRGQRFGAQDSHRVAKEVVLEEVLLIKDTTTLYCHERS